MRIPLLLLLATPAAHAGVLTFTTRGAFDTRSGPVQTEGFEHCIARTLAFAGPLDSSHPDAACPAGAILPGLTLSDSGPGGGALYLAEPRYAGNRTRAVGQNTRAADALLLEFARGSRAVGFDVYQNFGGGAQLGHAAPFDIRVWAGTTLLEDFTLLVPSGHGAFFGVISNGQRITRIAVDNPLAYDLVDNVSFTRPRASFTTSTPEPAAITLLGLGLTGLTVVRRRP